MVPVSAPVTVQRCPLSPRSSTTVNRRSGHQRRQLAGSATALPTSTGSAATKVSSAIWMLFMAYKLHICGPTAAEGWPTRLRRGKAAEYSREAKIVREFSVPATFTVGEHDNIVSSVFSHERDDPDHVIFQRLVDGAWTDVTCKQAASQIRSAALGLIAEGVKPGDRVAVLSATRYEWPILDFAILAAGAVTVPIYETSSAEQVQFVLADSGAVLIFAETDAHADKIEHLEHELPDAAQGAAHRGVGHAGAGRARRGGQVRSTRRNSTTGWPRITSADPATLIYTSGTTGRPKGCQLTHSNLLYEIRGAKECFPTLLDKGERMLVFLPLAHVLARAITIAAFANKVTLGFTSDIKNLVPTFGGVQADAGGVGAAGVREGVQHRRTERPQRRQGPDLRAGRRTPRSNGARPRTPAGPACCCGPSTRCSTGWSTASCAPRSAATAAARSPAARRWAPGSATSTAASA